MNDKGLLQEIEEDLARKELEAFWKTYGNWIIGAALAIVLATAAVTGWKTYQRGYSQKVTASMIQIIDDAKMTPAEKMAAFESYAKDYDDDHQAVLASLRAAVIAVDQKQNDKALAIYNTIANDKKIEPFFQQLGALMAVQLELDSGDPATLEARLNALRDKDGPFRFTAQEYAGYLALRIGDKAKAKQLFTELKNAPNVPADIAARAGDLANWLEGGE